MRKMLIDILTDPNKHNYCTARVLWILGVIFYFVLSLIAIIEGQPWSPTNYGIGLGAVLAGGGVATSLKNLNREDSKNEPVS